MIGTMPKFYNSPYFVNEPGNWHLKDGAPEDVQEEFEAYMKDSDMGEKVKHSFSGDAVEGFRERRAKRLKSKK